jgi:hypothetical protein
VHRHELDPLSLLFGAFFFLVGGVFLVGGTRVPGLHAGRLWPVPLVVLGLAIAGMAARAVAAGRDGRDAGEDERHLD